MICRRKPFKKFPLFHLSQHLESATLNQFFIPFIINLFAQTLHCPKIVTRRTCTRSFSLDLHRWARIKPAADGSPRPKARFGHSMNLVDGKVWVVGGMSDVDKFYNDVWVFDLSTLTLLPLTADLKKVACGCE